MGSRRDSFPRLRFRGRRFAAPRRDRLIALARHCIQYRELLAAFIGRELKARYRGSVLGGLWMLLQPIVFLTVYYVVFVEMFEMKMFPATDFSNVPELTPTQQLFQRYPERVSALAMFAALIPWTA